MSILRKTTSSIGLDIGTKSVKAAKVEHGSKGPILLGYGIELLQEGDYVSGEIKNPSHVAEMVSQAVGSCDPNMKDVIVSLSGFSVLHDIITMDLRPPKEIGEAVLMEAEQFSPFDMSDVEVDYKILHKDENTKKMKVLLVVAKNDIILSYIDFLGEAQLRPVIIDVDFFALQNILQHNYDLSERQSVLMLNIGYETTEAIFIYNGMYHSSRDVAIAGLSFIRELLLVPDMTPEKASDILTMNPDKELDPESLVDPIYRVAKELASAVLVAISFFQTTEDFEKLDLITLTGGYAWIPGLATQLERTIGTEVLLMNPTRNIEFDESLFEGVNSEQILSTLSTAIGLGLRKY